MTLAVTGATGFVGQAVLDEAARRGLTIRALTRREQRERDGVTWIRGDLANHAALGELMQGAEAVMHIAGVVNAPDTAGFEAGNVQGTQAVVDAALAAGVGRFVCVSSIAAREPALSDYCRTKRAAEEIVKAAPFDWTVIRPPAIFGPRDTEMFQLFRAARTGFLPMPPAGGRASVIHVDDLARLLLDVVPTGETVSGAIYEPDDGAQRGWLHGDLARAIGLAMGRRVWAASMPQWVLFGAARLDKAVRGAGAKLTPDRARYMVHADWVSDPSRAVPSQLWQPQVDTHQGLADTAQWYRDQRWI